MTWWHEAACRGKPTEWFYPAGNEDPKGRAICAECPVRAQCLADALARNEQHGLWGGMSLNQRRREKRTIIMVCAECGETFMASRTNVKYCGRPCRTRAWQRQGDTEKRRERWLHDPEYREQRRAQQRRWRQRQVGAA